MPIYKGSTNQGLIYYGSPNTNCLTSVPKNVKLELTYGAWAQPIFSSNTNGGLTLSASHESQPAWYAFNGDKTTNDNCWWTNHGVTSTSNPCWIQLKSAIKLKLNQVVIRNEHQSPENFKTAYLQVSNNGSSWTNVVTISGTNTGGYETTVNFTVSDGYYYYRLYFTESYSTGGVSIQTITFSGISQNILTLKSGSKVYVPNGFDINTSIVGSPIINNGIVSGLTSGNYVKTPNQLNLTTATDWEIVIKYTHLADSSLRGFCGLLTGDNIQCNFYITDSNTVQSDGVWGNLESSTPLIVGSTYWTKLQFTGSQYILSLSTNGKDFINQSVIDSTTKVSLVQSFAFGCDRSAYSINDTVSIDLTQSYIKINGELWWQGKVGSGQPKFDVVTIESDVSVYFAGVGRGQCMAFYQPDVNTLGWYPTNECVSGTTQTGSVFYNTSTNTIKFIGENQRGSLPFGIIYETNGSGISSIDQIFDWCGFIGSTAFVLPGVKGLKSNGIKADGTYNNIEVETKSVLLNNYDYQTTNQQFGLSENGNFIWRTDKYYSKPTAPTLTAYSIWHNITDNFNYYTGLDTSTGWVKTTGYDFNVVNSISTDSSFKITSLIPVTVQPLSTGITISNVYKGSTLVYHLGFDPVTFTENGTWTVPAGIKQIRVDCVAAQGLTFVQGTAEGGLGGRVQCVLSVTSGQLLYIKVGKQYTTYTDNRNDSIVYINNDELQALIHAGGGGSAANPTWLRYKVAKGGAGGGLTGGVGTADAPTSNILAQGGSQSAGGDGSYFNYPHVKGIDGRSTGKGKRLYGGNAVPDSGQYRCGCGGAGYYGGGGGLDAYHRSGHELETWAMGGGGGSSYTHPTLCSEVVHTQGFKNGNGYVTISMV